MAAKPLRLIVWADPGQEAIIQDAVGRGGFELVAIGSPAARVSGEFGETLAGEHVHTLREAIAREDVDLLWVAAPRRIEADERRLIREARFQTISSEPLLCSVADFLSDPREADTARFVPLLRQSPGYRAAGEVLEQIGPWQSLDVFAGSGPGQGTLFARLFDAMDLLQTLCGPAEMLDAAISGPGPGVPEELSGLRGNLTASVRFGDNRGAAVTVSDQAGRWSRRVTILAEGGCLRIDDDGFDWISPDGESVDAHREAAAVTPGALVAMEVQRRRDHLDAPDPPPDPAGLVALCEAARLSARTAAPEAPRKMLDMLKRP